MSFDRPSTAEQSDDSLRNQCVGLLRNYVPTRMSWCRRKNVFPDILSDPLPQTKEEFLTKNEIYVKELKSVIHVSREAAKNRSLEAVENFIQQLNKVPETTTTPESITPPGKYKQSKHIASKSGVPKRRKTKESRTRRPVDYPETIGAELQEGFFYKCDYTGESSSHHTHQNLVDVYGELDPLYLPLFTQSSSPVYPLPELDPQFFKTEMTENDSHFPMPFNNSSSSSPGPSDLNEVFRSFEILSKQDPSDCCCLYPF